MNFFDLLICLSQMTGITMKLKLITRELKTVSFQFTEKCILVAFGSIFIFFCLIRFRLGYTVALYPWRTIFITLALTLACSLGYFQFRSEKNPIKLWIPPGI